MKYSMRWLSIVIGATLLSGCFHRVDEVTPADIQAIHNAPAVEVSKADWPWWRGSSLDGTAVGPSPPTSWSEDENVIWKADLPGRGHATPSIWGTQIFVATADDAQESMSLICLRRSDGQQQWTREIHRGGFMHSHKKNSHASATPACDGEHVFTVFMVQGAIWVTAVDFQGKIVWQTSVGDFKSKHGYGSSPVLYKSLVIVAGDSSAGGFLTAIHRKSGKVIWRVRRDNKASFGSPVGGHVDGRDQLFLSGQDSVVSYDPASGKQLWKSRGPATTTANTMVWKDDLVFASGGWPQRNIMAIRADGSGIVVWEKDAKCYVPSPLVVEDRLYLVQDEGILRCLDVDTGKQHFVKRLGGGFSASPVLVGDNIYVPNESGTMFVFKASDKYEPVAQNDLGDGGFASPVVCDGRLYLRTDHRLYCIGKEKED